MLNKKLLHQLGVILDHASVMGNVYREKAYRRAITSISGLNFEMDLAAAQNTTIPGVGKGIREKIVEFYSKGNIEEVCSILESKEYTARKELGGITGVGPVTVGEWINMGIYNLRQLRRSIAKGQVKLNNMQKYGLLYYDDLGSRIPRNEVTYIGEIIKRALLQLDPLIVFTIAGSYRRGSLYSGDIDILVANKTYFNSDLLQQLEDSMHCDQNFVATMSAGAERITLLYKSGMSGRVRQVDVLNIAYGSYWAAINYFTGSYTFNAAIRGYAKSHGYRLNQSGLYKVGKGGQLNLVHTASEEEVFSVLGLEYVKPVDRENALLRLVETIK